MSDDTNEALVDLQIRLMHQEEAIEVLTQNFLTLERRVVALDKQIQDVKSFLTELMPSLVAPQDQEPPPPHY